MEKSLEWLETTIDVLEQRTMVPFYQPIIDMQTGKIKSYEVYYRIKYGDEYILPKFFVSISEKAGIIEDISKAVFDKAFRRMSFTDYDFHINLSCENLKYDVMKNYIIYLCSTYNINYNRVIINIVDSELLKVGSKSLRTLQSLKQLGFRLILKDFGIKNINMEMLIILDPDYARIHQDLIKKAQIHKKARKLLYHFMNYAKDVGMKTILVNVEEQEVYDVGKELGCEFAQGYLLGRPLDKLIDK
jgi:EAL domain-containing protein (putative c-di-GMP-specific phosphodiesterase class I)